MAEPDHENKSTEPYCRLCAELTPEDQLISADDEVGMHSKISLKLNWINVNLEIENFPKSICYSCFDLLERTWAFLNNVRIAQTKLSSIFQTHDPTNNHGHLSEENNSGKPKDVNWDLLIDNKVKIKEEAAENDRYNRSSLSNLDSADELLISIKEESINAYDLEIINNFSSDSDCKPLNELVKAKKKRKKVRFLNQDHEILLDDESILAKKLTWIDYTWSCGKCDAQCKTVDLLRLHSLEIHNTCGSFKCSDCNKIISTFDVFLNHIRKHYKSLKYSCEICNKIFKTTTNLKKHRRNSHLEYDENICTNCGASFEAEESLKEHIKLISMGKKKRKKSFEPQGELICEICNRKFKSKGSLATHKRLHMQRSRDYSCHMCGKMFFTKGSLIAHLSTHDEVKPYKCEFCSMSFKARGNLTCHISMHSEAKPYVCEQCGKCFRAKRHLKSHSIVHTDLMPYSCEFCTKTFRFKTRLNLHKRQHTGAKPYHCEICRRDFTNGSNYKKHMKRRHNIDTSVRKKMYGLIKSINENEQIVDSKENMVKVVQSVQAQMV